MFVSLIAAFALASAPASQGEDNACASRYGTHVCTTPALIPVRAEMEQKFAANLATGNRTATWQARHAAVLHDLRAGVDYEGKRLSDIAFEQMFRDHIAELDKALAQAAALRALPAGSAGRQCLATWLDQGCNAPASGTLWSKAGPVYWQQMQGASGIDGVGAGIMLWTVGRNGVARLVGWSFDGVNYEPPRLTQNGMIWVPGRMMGTGEGNADLLFQWDDDAGWQDVELESWRDSLDAKLPKGFGVWKGVAYDFEGMAAASKLWRVDDPNCCPSGGEVLLEYAVEGRKLVLKDVRPDIVEKWASPAKD